MLVDGCTHNRYDHTHYGCLSQLLELLVLPGVQIGKVALKEGLPSIAPTDATKHLPFDGFYNLRALSHARKSSTFSCNGRASRHCVAKELPCRWRRLARSVFEVSQ